MNKRILLVRIEKLKGGDRIKREEKYFGRKELLRYSLIVPLINGTNPYSTIDEYCEEVSKGVYEFNKEKVKFKARTIKGWYYKYLKEGLESLEKHERRDKNNFRKIKDESVEERIINLRKEYPKITTKAMYKKLIEEGYITDKVSIYSIFRYLKNNNLKAVEISKKEKKKYEQEKPNDCWQSDTSSGPYIVVEGKKVKTYLISVIDDTSRLIVGYGFFYNDNGINMQKVLSEAIKKYGVPKKLYVDNGTPYKNEQLSIIMARLGIELVHARPYSPTGKGKIERSFRTIKDGWMNCSDWNKFKSIEDVEKSFSEFLYNEYQNKEHSETKETPNNRYHSNKEIKRKSKEEIEEAFMHTRKCKVYNNSTIKINKEAYEVPYKYVGKTIEVRYYVSNIEKMWVYEENKRKEEVKKPNVKENSKTIRKDNIDYSKMVNKEKEAEEI